MYNWHIEKLQKIYEIFPRAFINDREEVILSTTYNVYFLLEDVESGLEFDCKVLECLCRPSHKGIDKKQHKYFRDKLNRYFGTDWNVEDLSLIYTYIGNGINRKLCIKFIESGFDLEVIREYERNKYGRNFEARI